MAEIVHCIATDVENDIPEGELALVKGFVGSPIFQNFIAQQLQSVDRQLRTLNPRAMKDTDFHSLASDLRLLARFWADFGSYAEDCAMEAEQTREDQN